MRELFYVTFLEYHTLSKIGISDGQKYLKKRFNSRKDSCMFLSTCCLSQHMIDRVDAEIEEILRNEGWGELKVSSIFFQKGTSKL